MAQPKSGKRTKKIVEAEGVAHITATFNNTLITIADLRGNAVAWPLLGVPAGGGSVASQRGSSDLVSPHLRPTYAPSTFTSFVQNDSVLGRRLKVRSARRAPPYTHVFGGR